MVKILMKSGPHYKYEAGAEVYHDKAADELRVFNKAGTVLATFTGVIETVEAWVVVGEGVPIWDSTGSVN